MLFGPESFASNSSCAKVLELEGTVESKMSGQETRSLRPGMSLTIGEELDVGSESWIVLMMADSSVRKFNGPASITMEENVPEVGGSILTRVGSAIVELLFAREDESSEVVMVTRLPDRPDDPAGKKSHLPLLVHPSPGSSVFQGSKRFEWRTVEGIPLYRVSVYGWDRLLWQATTSNSSVDCPQEHCNFKPGETYHWVVEGLIGNSSLRSKPAEFKVLSEEVSYQLQHALSNPDLSIPAKARLCLSLNLYEEALRLPKGTELSRQETHLLRAEIKERMGLFEDALFEYRSAYLESSAK
jgi:hypothetical protein